MHVAVKDYGFRRVVRVTTNDDEPKWVHPDGTVPVQPHSGDTEEAKALGVTACKVCRLNHHTEEFSWDVQEMVVPLNEWGNPVHDDQPAVNVRTKKWGELLAEIEDGRPSSKGGRIKATLPKRGLPVEHTPALVPEVYPEFDVRPTGEPKTDGVTVSRESVVLHFGSPKARFTANGETQAGFEADREAKKAAAVTLIGEEAAVVARARQIAGD